MPEETQTDPESIVKPDAPGDLETLDVMIAADEAVEAEQKRDNKGRFKEATKGQPPAQRLTPEIVSAKTGKTDQDAEAKATASASQSDPKTGDKPPEEKQAAEAKTEPEKSKYEKAKERQESAWKAINDRKAELEIREKAIEARERQARSTRPAEAQQPTQANGERVYTQAELTGAAAQWEQTATRLEARAKELEDAGDFEKADRCAQQAKEQRELAADAKAMAKTAPTHRPAPQAQGAGNGAPAESDMRMQWAIVKTDLPEVLVVGSPLNKAVQDYIGKNPAILEQPNGVIRAVLQTGRNVVAQLEREAMRVPELQKANAALSEKLKGLEAELQRATSLPGGGGYQRGEGGRSFDHLTTKEQEAQLDAELAGHL